MDVSPLLIAALVSAAIAVLICLHHGWEHCHDPEDSHAKQESCGCCCYLQASDICNFATWNHEMFIITFYVAAVALFVASFFA